MYMLIIAYSNDIPKFHNLIASDSTTYFILLIALYLVILQFIGYSLTFSSQ